MITDREKRVYMYAGDEMLCNLHVVSLTNQVASALTIALVDLHFMLIINVLGHDWNRDILATTACSTIA